MRRRGKAISIQNRVGAFVPSEKEIQDLVKDVQTLAAKLQKCMLTSTATVRHLPVSTSATRF
jgi:hypothetical protein